MDILQVALFCETYVIDMGHAPNGENFSLVTAMCHAPNGEDFSLVVAMCHASHEENFSLVFKLEN